MIEKYEIAQLCEEWLPPQGLDAEGGLAVVVGGSPPSSYRTVVEVESLNSFAETSEPQNQCDVPVPVH